MSCVTLLVLVKFSLFIFFLVVAMIIIAHALLFLFDILNWRMWCLLFAFFPTRLFLVLMLYSFRFLISSQNKQNKMFHLHHLVKHVLAWRVVLKTDVYSFTSDELIWYLFAEIYLKLLLIIIRTCTFIIRLRYIKRSTRLSEMHNHN